MRNAILAATFATLITAFTAVGASAQMTGPAGQDTTKMGTESGMSKEGMSKDGMKKDGMKKGSMDKSNMKKGDMSKDGMKKDNMSK